MFLKQFCNLKCLKITKKIDFCSLRQRLFNRKKDTNRETGIFFGFIT